MCFTLPRRHQEVVLIFAALGLASRMRPRFGGRFSWFSRAPLLAEDSFEIQPLGSLLFFTV